MPHLRLASCPHLVHVPVRVYVCLGVAIDTVDCVSLTWLNLSNNLVKSLEGAENYKEIMVLNAGRNEISSIEPLVCMACMLLASLDARHVPKPNSKAALGALTARLHIACALRSPAMWAATCLAKVWFACCISDPLGYHASACAEPQQAAESGQHRHAA